MPARGIPSVSLWAAVPHYVSLAPSPRAARALCDRLSGVLGIEIDVGELAEAEETYVEQVSEAVASDAETAAYVEELEQRADSLDWLEESGSLPSGEALAAEIARFLRERDKNGGSRQPARRRLRRARRRRHCRRPSFRPWTASTDARAPGACGWPLRLRRRRRDLRAVSLGAGRLSASAFAISSIVPSSSRASSSAAFARGV